jgi:hypothetical protein
MSYAEEPNVGNGSKADISRNADFLSYKPAVVFDVSFSGIGLTNHARPNPTQKPHGTINFINFPSAKIDNRRRHVGSALQEWRSLH